MSIDLLFLIVIAATFLYPYAKLAEQRWRKRERVIVNVAESQVIVDSRGKARIVGKNNYQVRIDSDGTWITFLP